MAELEASTDAFLIGAVGEHLTQGARPDDFPPEGAESWLRETARMRADYAQRLLERAESLDPANPRWPEALKRLRAARENALAPPAPSQSATMPPGTPQRIRIGGAVQQANLLHSVAPVYPPLARQARIQGVVRFNVIIGNDGHVKNIILISGHPLLVPAAQEAVEQWVYRPTLLNGNPVEVATVVDVPFTLPREN